MSKPYVQLNTDTLKSTIGARGNKCIEVHVMAEGKGMRIIATFDKENGALFEVYETGGSTKGKEWNISKGNIIKRW